MLRIIQLDRASVYTKSEAFGNAILLNGAIQTANLEIGVPGIQWGCLAVAQPLLAVRCEACPIKGLHRQECLCYSRAAANNVTHYPKLRCIMILNWGNLPVS
jgi:hypothetical protein